ncbi:MAG: GGDEF domain-containing response regulator [Sulfuricellaceae bacterium]|nr:GGDEF domain-containing response regulator [Sulfuricellaceae bacterium]
MEINDDIRILFIENKTDNVSLVREQLAGSKAHCLKLESAGTLAAGLARLDQADFDVLLLDPHLPDSSGLKAIAAVKNHAPTVPVVAFCDGDDESMYLQAVRAGAQDCLIKGQADARLLIRSLLFAIERHRRHAALRSLLLVDELTGLYNRRGFMTLADHQKKLADRKGNGFYLIFADLDGMKDINDTFGHGAGDLALQETAHILNETFRGSDILGRMGGDEFAALTIDSNNDSGKNIAQRLQDCIEQHNRRGNYPFRLSISTGTVHYEPNGPESLEELIASADKLMYEEKRGKKACRKG